MCNRKGYKPKGTDKPKRSKRAVKPPKAEKKHLPGYDDEWDDESEDSDLTEFGRSEGGT